MCQTDHSDFQNLVDVMMHFSDEETCKSYLTKMRWNGKPVCQHCGHDEKIYKMKKGYKCSVCRKPFSVTKGSIF
jgi:transposase-like protein